MLVLGIPSGREAPGAAGLPWHSAHKEVGRGFRTTRGTSTAVLSLLWASRGKRALSHSSFYSQHKPCWQKEL